MMEYEARCKKYYEFYDMVWLQKINKNVFIKIGNSRVLDGGRITLRSTDYVKQIAESNKIYD